RIGDAFGAYPEYDPNNASRMSTVTLTGNNTYSGGTTLFSGRLVIGDANALGTGALTVSGSASGIQPRLETSLTSNPVFNKSLVVGTSFEIGGSNPFTWQGAISDGGVGSD